MKKLILIFFMASILLSQEMETGEVFDKEKYERGKGLFSGEIIFKNKGTPCISCHDIKGVFSFGGGKFGPGLEDAFENYGEDGLLMALSDIPFPAMLPIYKYKPLDSTEIEDIVYFLKNVKKEERQNNLFVPVLFGVILIFSLPLLIWRNRTYGVRRNLLKGGK